MALTYTHRRPTWLPPEAWPPGSPVFDWTPIQLFVVHWPGSDGAIDGDPGEASDRLDDWLRSVQRFYRDVRGYNIGYNMAVDYLGGSWELRGEEFKCAANAGLNDIAIACIVMTDLDGKITPQAIAAVQRMYAQAKAIKPSIRLIGHGQGPSLFPLRKPTATSCPGPLIKLVNDGTFASTPAPPPVPVPVMPMPTGTYTVVAGDGWYVIARKTGMLIGDLLALNKMTLMTPLHPGMVLRVATSIPPPPDTSTWVTPPGEPPFGLDATDASTIMTGWPTGRVSWLQGILGVPMTGIYNAMTVARMIELQRIAGAVTDGVYGPQTERVFLIWRGR